MEDQVDDPKRISARQWMKRINRSLKFRDQVRDRQNWKRILEEYKGEYKVNSSGINSPPINLVYGYVHTAIPRIYFRDPHMSINPKGAESIGAARVLELVINYIFRELNLKNEVHRLLLDAFLYGHGWLKYGFIGKMGEAETEVPTEKSEYVKDEEIFAAYVPYEDVVFDVTLCQDPPHDCRWIAHRIIRPVSEIKDDTKYENTGKIKSNITARDAKGDKVDDALKDSDLELFEFWEVHDKDSNKIYCVAQNMDRFLRETENVYAMEGLPFSMLKFNMIPGEPYPLSDIFIIEAQILERIRLRASQLNHVKRWNRQLSIEINSMAKEEMEKFSQGIDGAITQRAKGSEPPTPIQYAPIPAESFQIDNLIQRDIDTVIGQSEVDRGGEAKTQTNTKFELQGQLMATSSRQSLRQDKLEDFLEEVARKIIALVKQFQTTPKYIRITGMDEAQIAEAFAGMRTDSTGIYFTKDDIQGEYDIEAKAGSTLPLNRENRVKIIESALNPVIAQVLGIMPGSPTSIALGKALFRELDMPEVSKAFDVQSQQMQQLQQSAPGLQMGPDGQPLPPESPQPAPGAPAGGGENVQHVVNYQAPPGLPPPGMA